MYQKRKYVYLKVFLTSNKLSQILKDLIFQLSKPLAIAHIFESIDELLLDNPAEKFNIQEIASFVSHICHLLEKEFVLL